MKTFEQNLQDLCEGAETFVCAFCHHTLPVEYRHPEKPEYCFMDYVSETDAAEISRIVDEEMTAAGYVRTEAK